MALPTYKNFAKRHGYDVVVGGKMTERPPAWNKLPLMTKALEDYDEVVWFDCDLVVVNPVDDFPRMREGAVHSMVRHFERDSEVPNSGVWRVNTGAMPLLSAMSELVVFEHHGWWEQAALMTLMGYCVPPEGSDFMETRCRCVRPTRWHAQCDFMRLAWNSHPNYRAASPRIVHCSYPDMQVRLEVMRALSRNATFNYPRYDISRAKKDDDERLPK